MNDKYYHTTDSGFQEWVRLNPIEFYKKNYR